MKDTVSFLMTGADVVRYHTVATIARETVGHHSHGVAALCLVLHPLASRQLLIGALYHDLAEQRTGDIPAPAKREFGIGQAVWELELRILKSAGLITPELTPQEARVLKLADIAQGALYCVKEMSMGNRNLRVVLQRYLSYAEGMLLVGRECELFNVIKELARECE